MDSKAEYDIDLGHMTWKAKEEMAAEPGGGSEDHAGQKMVGEGGV
jgi:hypothetical protein